MIKVAGVDKNPRLWVQEIWSQEVIGTRCELLGAGGNRNPLVVPIY